MILSFIIIDYFWQFWFSSSFLTNDIGLLMYMLLSWASLNHFVKLLISSSYDLYKLFLNTSAIFFKLFLVVQLFFAMLICFTPQLINFTPKLKILYKKYYKNFLIKLSFFNIIPSTSNPKPILYICYISSTSFKITFLHGGTLQSLRKKGLDCKEGARVVDK